MNRHAKSLGILIALLAAPLVNCTALDTSQTTQATTTSGDCTFTQGFWKNHPDAWPVSELTLGSNTYSKAELLAIFDLPVRGNGLISLAHQLIAAKLNIENGADDTSIASAITDADALIGSLEVGGSGYLSTDTTSSLVGALDRFNNSTGETCEPEPRCGDGELDEGEECDDGNTDNGDGCSSTCVCEPEPPVCGNGIVEAGEQCDDGNQDNYDGCTTECICPPTTQTT